MAAVRHISFLVEIGTEELPPTELALLRDHFCRIVLESLEAQMHASGMCSLSDICKAGGVDAYATPRRIAVRATKIPLRPDPGKAIQQITGPGLEYAFDQHGRAQKAAVGFARKHGIDKVVRLEELVSLAEGAQSLSIDKQYPSRAAGGNAWLCRNQDKLLVCVRAPEAKVPELLLAATQEACSALPARKTMRWGSGDAEFPRPVRRVLALYDTHEKKSAHPRPVQGEVLGVPVGKCTSGHPFMAQPKKLPPLQIDNYDRYLKELKVIPSMEEREALIRREVEKQAGKLGGYVRDDASLYREVSALTEWPVALQGSFEKRFLKLPQELLESVMSQHQRYFPVYDEKSGRLMNHFVFISNIPDRAGNIVRGNQRVIAPRLADAEFFYKQDCKTTLEQLAQGLRQRSFQQDGQKSSDSMWDKIKRMHAIGGFIREYLGPGIDWGDEELQRANLLCKADLQGAVVTEFPNLQGVMGAQYARLQGEPAVIVSALAECYLPRHASDRLPQTSLGANLALADRLDNLCALMDRGIESTGAGDPFGLRRAALGINQILMDCREHREVTLRTLLERIASAQYARNKALADKVFVFILERLKTWLNQSHKYPRSLIEATCAGIDSAEHAGRFRVHDYAQRLEKVQAFSAEPTFADLVTLHKRLRNILREAHGKVPDAQATKTEPSHGVRPEHFEHDSERALYATLQESRQILETAYAKATPDYGTMLKAMARIAPKVEHFFDAVMVMSEHPTLRKNRVNLLRQLESQLYKIADFSIINIKNQAVM